MDAALEGSFGISDTLVTLSVFSLGLCSTVEGFCWVCACNFAELDFELKDWSFLAAVSFVVVPESLVVRRSSVLPADVDTEFNVPSLSLSMMYS